MKNVLCPLSIAMTTRSTEADSVVLAPRDCVPSVMTTWPTGSAGANSAPKNSVSPLIPAGAKYLPRSEPSKAK